MNTRVWRGGIVLVVLASSLSAVAMGQDFEPFPVKLETGKPVKIDLTQYTGKGTYIRMSGPEGLQISREGILTWTPQFGEHSLMVAIDPRREVHRYRLKVVDPAGGVATEGGQKRLSYECKGIGYGVLLPDQNTVVLSIPAEGKLIFFDTRAFKELRQVQLDFKPGCMAVQKGTLFVAAEGAASVYALELPSGKQRAEIEVPGNGVVGLACHPLGGPVFASTGDLKVYAIDPARAEATTTKAKGRFLAVAPHGDFLYTGVQPATQDEIRVIEQSDGSLRLIWDRWGARAFMVKYTVRGNKLAAVAVNPNAAVNAKSLAQSADGTVVAMPGGGGWRPRAPETGGGYDVVFFRTKDMVSTAGKVSVGAYPHGLAFHPTLRLGATWQGGVDKRLIIFDSKSFIIKSELSLKNAPQPDVFLLFGDGGRRIVYASSAGLHSLPLELSKDELAALKSRPKPEPPKASEAEDVPLTREWPMRTWTDSSGVYNVQARFAGVVGGNVALITKEGNRVYVPTNKLSQADQKYLRDELAKRKK